MIEQRDVMNAAWMYNKYKEEENLQVLLDKIEDYFKPPPENFCSWCGITDHDNREDGFGPCTDISVMTANGEEGFAHEVRWACQEHLCEVTVALVGLGFGSHRHGGINFLEDYRCPGLSHRNDCPTPEIEG